MLFLGAMTDRELAQLILRRADQLGQITEEPGRLTRTFCSPAMLQANQIVARWMEEAGMRAYQDAIGNLVADYAGLNGKGPVLVLGSHLDTVRDAGKYDGALGVLGAIACVHQLTEEQIRLPFGIRVIGFADEEGVRYGSTYLGSRVVAGSFDPALLQALDARGIAMGEAIRDFGGNPENLREAAMVGQELMGYVEVHIEQGPVLEERQLAVGVVSAIAGQTRVKVTFTGKAGHAGTTPMLLRQDALCGAGEFVVEVEKFARKQDGLVATVGQLNVAPGASNVIPGTAELTVDVRHPNDAVRKECCAGLEQRAGQIAAARKLTVQWHAVHENAATTLDARLSATLAEAVQQQQGQTISLPSGAGHDAAVMAMIVPAAMLFVRCKGGLSHHPDEAVSLEDVQVTVAVMKDFLQRLGGPMRSEPAA